MKALALVLIVACGSSPPPIRYYQLAQQGQPVQSTGTQVLVVEALTSEGAYDDDRIVYRNNPYRLDYYDYHRWSASPGIMVGGYLEQALGRSGSFKAVVRETVPDATLVLGGRITAIEEVDRDATHWVGRIALELTLTNPRSGAIVWSQPFEEVEPLPTQNPEGLARALSVALDRISRRAAPLIIDHATPETAAK